MILFRATYTALPGAACRHISFAACDAAEAERTARAWALDRRLLTVRAVRELQLPQQAALEATK